MGRIPARAFWYLRHGQTDWNAQNLAQGAVDIPLNQVGQAQARDAAERLRNRGIRTIVASPLSRARDTAQAVADVLGLPVHLDDELREVAFGMHEQQPMLDWFDDWVEGRLTPEGAESFLDLRTRAAAALSRALGRDAPVLVVAHGALFRAVRAEMGLAPNLRTANGTPLFCEPGARPDAPWTLTAHG